MIRLARKAHEEPEIPTASMADIAFLLIIFFMLTSVFAATRGMPFQQPEEEQKAAEGKPAINIWVRDTGNGETALLVNRKEMTLAEVLPYVDQQLRREPGKPVLLYTDPDAPYRAMIEVYDELMKAPAVTGRKLESIYIPTTRDVEEYTRLFGFNPFTVEGP